MPLTTPLSAPTPGLSPQHVRDLVVRPILARLSLPSPVLSEHLLMGTAAQESQFRYLTQLGGGPALGLWQMEPYTFHDLWNRVVLKTSIGREIQTLAVPGIAPVSQLPWNLYLAAAMCRVHYYARPFTLPADPTLEDLRSGYEPDVEMLASLWKEHYNTSQGRGTTAEFVANYNRLIAPIY